MKIQMPEKPTWADFPHLVTHSQVPDDPYERPAGDPPKEPFEALGAEALKLSWENRGIRRSRFPMVPPDWRNEHLLALAKGPHAGMVRVKVGTFTPNLDAVEVRVDEQPWSVQGADFLWFPHQGENSLRVRTRNRFGVLGRESSVQAVLKKKG